MKKLISILVIVALIITSTPIKPVDSAKEVYSEWWEQGITNKRLAEMVESGEIPANVTHLYLQNNQISDVKPLSKLTELNELYLNVNQISDITPLSKLINLQHLELGCNEIADITPLSKLIKLQRLNLNDNKIKDTTPLSKLTKLQWLYLDNNKIANITPLSKLTKLQRLDLDNNKIRDLTPLESLLTNLIFVSIYGNPVDQNQIDNLEMKRKKLHTFVNRVLGEQPVTIAEALEILKYLAGMESVIDDGNAAFYAARITGGDKPRIDDVLEILKKLAGMKSMLDST